MQGVTLPLDFTSDPDLGDRWPIGTPQAWGLGDVFPLGPAGLRHRVVELMQLRGTAMEDLTVIAEWRDFPHRLAVVGVKKSPGFRASFYPLTGEWRGDVRARKRIAMLPRLLRPVRTVADVEARATLLGHAMFMTHGEVRSMVRRALVAGQVSGEALRRPLYMVPDGRRVSMEVAR